MFDSNPSENAKLKLGDLKPGDIEYEFGIPIPGIIAPPEQWTQTALKRLPVEGKLSLPNLFGRIAPVAVDIGCGNGRFALASAVRRPDWDHLAIDILPAVLRYATRRANQRGLSNVRFAACDGWKLLHDFLDDDTVQEFHIYHPQPYADPRDASKRMMTPDFIKLLHTRLKPLGQVFVQTDRLPYWEYMQSSLGRVFDWHSLDAPWPEDPHGRSRRELLSIEQGLPIYRGIATRREFNDPNELDAIIASLPQPDFEVESSSKRNKPRTPRRRPRRRR